MQSLGRHVIAEFYNCPADKLNGVTAIEKAMVDSAEEAGATVINSTFHHFAPMGVSGVVVIQESHLAIHTWPEYGFAAVDIFTCGDTVSPWKALELLKMRLEAEHVSSIEMRRGQTEQLPEPQALPYGNSQNLRTIRKRTKELWFTERAGELALSVKHEGELLEQRQSAYQRIEVLKTQALGDLLVLDGIIATSTLDGPANHEMLVHPAMLSHPNPQKAIVIGGGDGGVVRELLRYDSLEKISVLEQDEEVVEVARKWLPQWASSLKQPKVELIFGDAHLTLNTFPNHSIDILIVDAYNPAQMENPQWEEQFFGAVSQVLSRGGVAVFQLGSPWVAQQGFEERVYKLQQQFGVERIYPYLASLPSYPTGLWAFALVVALGADPKNTLEENWQNLESASLEYFNREVHQHCWALPNFVKKMMMPGKS